MKTTSPNPSDLRPEPCETIPNDLHHWLDTNRLLHLALEAVHTLSWRTKTGSTTTEGIQPNPRQVLTLLTYCYLSGLYASEEIERRLSHDGAISYLGRPGMLDRRHFVLIRGQNYELLKRCVAHVLERACAARSRERLAPLNGRIGAGTVADHLVHSAEKLLFLTEAERRVRAAIQADHQADAPEATWNGWRPLRSHVARLLIGCSH